MNRELVAVDIRRARPYLLEITDQELILPGLPEALHGATVVHLTDLHTGFGKLEAVYEEVLARVAALEPEWVLLTGDFIDDGAPSRSYPLTELLRRLRARRGLFACYGNHDHRFGTDRIRRYLDAADVHLLCNESLCLESGLWLVGVDDIFEGQPDVPRAFADVPPDTTALVLSHNPSLIRFVPDRPARILAGHTHGGQIALPILTPKIYCWLHLRCPYVSGWFQNGRASLYVNRGVGVTGQPFRYNCPAEMAIFRLQPAPQTPSASAEREAVGQR